MRERQSNKLLYGIDIFSYSEMRSKVELAGFMNYSDVDVIDIADFFYSSFDYKGYNYILYDDQGAISFPVASVFSSDISQLPFLSSAATFNYKPQDTYIDEKTNYAFQKGEDTEDVEDCQRIFRTYDFPAHIDFLSTLFSVHITYKQSNKVTLYIPTSKEKQIASVVQKFFSLSSSDIKVVQSDDRLELADKYMVSLIRAAIIATKAAFKYKCDIIYQFNPFFIVGNLKIDDYLYIRMDNTSIVKRDMKISYDMGKSTLYEDRIVWCVEKSLDSILLAKYQRVDITLSHNDIYSSTVTEEYLSSYIHSATCYAFLEIARAFKVTSDYYLSFLLEARKDIDSDYSEKLKAVDSFFSSSHFRFKDAIYRHNSSIAPPVSTLEFESKRAIVMMPALIENKISLCLISFNKKLREISDIYILLPYYDADRDVARLTSYMLKALKKYGFRFSDDFSSYNIHTEAYLASDSEEISKELDPMLFCSIFTKSFKLEYENL